MNPTWVEISFSEFPVVTFNPGNLGHGNFDKSEKFIKPVFKFEENSSQKEFITKSKFFYYEKNSWFKFIGKCNALMKKTTKYAFEILISEVSESSLDKSKFVLVSKLPPIIQSFCKEYRVIVEEKEVPVLVVFENALNEYLKEDIKNNKIWIISSHCSCVAGSRTLPCSHCVAEMRWLHLKRNETPAKCVFKETKYASITHSVLMLYPQMNIYTKNPIFTHKQKADYLYLQLEQKFVSPKREKITELRKEIARLENEIDLLKNVPETKKGAFYELTINMKKEKIEKIDIDIKNIDLYIVKFFSVRIEPPIGELPLLAPMPRVKKKKKKKKKKEANEESEKNIENNEEDSNFISNEIVFTTDTFFDVNANEVSDSESEAAEEIIIPQKRKKPPNKKKKPKKRQKIKKLKITPLKQKKKKKKKKKSSILTTNRVTTILCEINTGKKKYFCCKPSCTNKLIIQKDLINPVRIKRCCLCEDYFHFYKEKKCGNFEGKIGFCCLCYQLEEK